MKRAVKTATFGGKRYRVVEHDVDGWCDRKTGPMEICVSPRLRGQAASETWIHEAMHAEFPAMPEPVVERSARSVAWLLWRLGYKRKR